ncbi:glycosyltransferase family 2 protein [Bergeriella denitrificans]|uniref:Glycosyl transferase family protein n=1 Tax=Bergeriella denitrificans TaxID=494 RepID=A0A378UHJ5_BERDE|nr:glycosyltransferase family A protein [Bergeriella denitrificans]STZ76796.1 glycosyl transferase family protein [Bergeriella denitrificans]
MNTAAPLVSVMIPYYNCKEYIAETVASVEQQTYPAVEIIIIDDGSAPEHRDYLQNLLAEKPHIRYAHQENQGVSAARNHAARLAQGQYFLFLDADDIILPEYIAKAVAVLEHDPDCKLVYPQAELFGAESGLWTLLPYRGLDKLLEGNHIPIIAMHRTQDFQTAEGFDERLYSHEDWDLWIRILEKGGNAVTLPDILFRYRKRHDLSSLTNDLLSNETRLSESWQHVYIKHSQKFIESGLSYYHLIHDLNYYRSRYNRRIVIRIKNWVRNLKNMFSKR